MQTQKIPWENDGWWKIKGLSPAITFKGNYYYYYLVDVLVRLNDPFMLFYMIIDMFHVKGHVKDMFCKIFLLLERSCFILGIFEHNIRHQEAVKVAWFSIYNLFNEFREFNLKNLSS